MSALPSALAGNIAAVSMTMPADFSASPTIISLELPTTMPADVAASPTTMSLELPTIPNPTLNDTPDTPLPGPVDSGTYHPSLATHAARNSNFFVQPIRKITKLSDAQKASRLLRQKVEQEEHHQLIEEFDALLLRHSQEQEELALKFSVKTEYLDKLKGTSKHFKVKRSVNIENAKIHKKSIEMNEGTLITSYFGFLSFLNKGREIGDRLRINELRLLVKDDPKLQNLSKAEEKELQEELLASREEKRLGARPSNRSAAQDYRRHIAQINDDVSKTVPHLSSVLISSS